MPTITKIFELPPKESDAQIRARELLQFSNELQEILYKHFEKLYMGLWNSDVPPAEIIEALGTNGVGFFIKAGAFVEFLATHCNVVFAEGETGSKLPLEFHPDGTVTVVSEE